MKYSTKVREKAAEGVKKLISEGNDREAVLISIADLTGVPRDKLELWLAVEEARRKNHLATPEKVDKLKDYRDKRWNKTEQRHPDDIKLEEIQGEYLANNYDF